MKSIIVTVLVLGLGSAALAGGDKTSETCVDISSLNGGSNGFVNGSSSSKIKSGGCKLQVQLKGLSGISDGDILICLGEADVRATALPPGAFGNSVVLRGVAKAGSLKMKADLAAIGCGAAGVTAINWNGNLKCYKPDATYTDVTNDAANWKATCLASGTNMVPLPNPGLDVANDDPVKVNLLGLCQGFTADAGERINPPTSGEICRQGQTNPPL